MKKLLSLLIICSFLMICGTGFSSCSKKTGCPITENAHVKPDKNGKLPSKRGKSGLFPKKMRKKRN